MVSRHPHRVEQVVQPALPAHLLDLVDALCHESRVILMQAVLSASRGGAARGLVFSKAIRRKREEVKGEKRWGSVKVKSGRGSFELKAAVR